jgi:iron only hydrogenase large subunit-like protein
VRKGRADVMPVYTEVMACPGGCTNGGGQIKAEDEEVWKAEKPVGQKELLLRVDEAYFSEGEEEERERHVGVKEAVRVWESITGVQREVLLHTKYRVVENDLGGRLGEKEVLEIASRSEAW